MGEGDGSPQVRGSAMASRDSLPARRLQAGTMRQSGECDRKLGHTTRDPSHVTKMALWDFGMLFVVTIINYY